jgi:hypothetical protein
LAWIKAFYLASEMPLCGRYLRHNLLLLNNNPKVLQEPAQRAIETGACISALIARWAGSYSAFFAFSSWFSANKIPRGKAGPV